jgi:hypothetical protein
MNGKPTCCRRHQCTPSSGKSLSTVWLPSHILPFIIIIDQFKLFVDEES